MDAVKRIPDWNAVRISYVHSTQTLGEVAAQFGVTRVAACKRSEREGWAAQRLQASTAVAKAAEQLLLTRRIEDLAKWNEDDMKLARALRSQVAAQVNGAQLSGAPLSAIHIRSLASAAESIQRTGRLALGASTENHGLAGPGGEGPIQTTTSTLEEYELAARRILADI